MTAAELPEVQALAKREAAERDARPAPDLAVLRLWRRPPVEFPLEALPTRWATWAKDAATGSGCAVAFSACGLLGVAAGAIGNAARVTPFPGWNEPAVLWLCLVGESSDGKSPALDPFRVAIDALEARLGEPFEEALAAWQAEAAIAKARRSAWEKAVAKAIRAGEEPPPVPAGSTPPAEPGRPRLRISDATPEAVAAILEANPRGVIMFRDELASWLGSFGRYTGGAAGDRAMWLEAHGARSHVIDRVRTGSTRIERLAVSIIGTATPDKLAALALDENDGLGARFAWCWPAPLAPIIPESCANVEELEVALSWLRDLPMPGGLPMTLHLEREALASFHVFRLRHTDRTRGTAGILASAYGKAPGLVLRLALVLELLEVAGLPVPVPTSVSVGSIRRALVLWEAFFRPMAERVLGDASASQRDRDAATLARWIARERPATVNARSLRRDIRLPGLTTDAGRVRDAIEALVESGWLEPAPSRAGDNPGRNRADYVVRDDLLSMLDAAEGLDR